MSAATIILIVLTCVLATLVVCLSATIIYLFYFYPIPLNHDKYTIRQFRAFDLENQSGCSSLNRLKSGPLQITSRETYQNNPNQNSQTRITPEGDIIVTAIVGASSGSLNNLNLVLDYHDANSYIEPAIGTCNTGETDDSTIMNRLAQLSNTPVDFNEADQETVSVSPENHPNQDQFDSFNMTLMLQRILEKDINSSQSNFLMKRVIDPYLDNMISVGGIVVVIKPFFGAEGYEFSCLQPGDLIRVVKFYVKDARVAPRKLKIAKQNLNDSSPIFHFGDNGDLVDKQSEVYDNVYCSGVLLNTYLKADSNCLRLKVKALSQFAEQERELLKDFPLSCVSLETTLLTSV